MYTIRLLASMLLAATLAACSGIDTKPADTTDFAAAGFQYYDWRNPPLENTHNSRDPIYLTDRLVRDAVNAELQSKGYRLDPERAQFTVDFVAAAGMRQGVPSEQASNISTRPQAINRRPDQATVDNAQALAGVVDTNNLALIFRDRTSGDEVWQVLISKIVEDANFNDTDRARRNVEQAVRKGLRTLPNAP